MQRTFCNYLVNPNRFFYILKRFCFYNPRNNIFLVADIVMDCFRDENASGIRDSLYSGCYIYSISKYIFVFKNHFAQMNADP